MTEYLSLRLRRNCWDGVHQKRKRQLEESPGNGPGAKICRNYENRGLLPSNIQRRKWLQFQY